MAKSIIYGIHSIQAILEKDPQTIRTLWIDRKSSNKRLDPLIKLAKQYDISIQLTKTQQLDKLAQTIHHQSIVADYKANTVRVESDLYALLETDLTPLILVLDGVTDPHNLGACLRTAEGAGAQAVVIPKNNSVGLTPIVRKVASGAAEQVPLITVTNLARCLNTMKTLGLWIIGTSNKTKQTIYDQNLTMPVALIMGAEGKGIRPLTEKQCDILVKLPMMGQVSSLNVSVATGICLYEALRQRQAQ